MRLIDADAIELRYSFGMLDPDGVVCIPMKDVRKSIAKTPTVDAVPVVHGVWHFKEFVGDDWYSKIRAWECSNCEYHIETKSRHYIIPKAMRYCPYCGAKMDGDADV